MADKFASVGMDLKMYFLTSFINDLEKNQPTNGTITEKTFYIIRCIEKLFILFEEKFFIITHADFKLSLQLLFQAKILHLPNNNPLYDVKPSDTSNTFNYSEWTPTSDENEIKDCTFCKQLGLPVEIYASHFMENEEGCPLYPLHNKYIVNIEEVVRAVSSLVCKMNFFEYCADCFKQKKSEEMSLSHVYQLSTGEIMCPFNLDRNENFFE